MAVTTESARDSRSGTFVEPQPHVTRPVALFVALLSVGTVGTWLYYAGRGLDLMDESYVLRLIDTPDASRPAGEVYLFGFLVNPIFESLGRDVADLRVVALLFVALLAAGTSWAVLGSVGMRSDVRWVFALTSAAATTSVFTLGVRLPGYRVVCLVGLLLVVMGAAMARTRAAFGAGVLVGVGLVVAFCGKPTSAVAAAVMVMGLARPLGLLNRKSALGLATGGVGGCLMVWLSSGLGPSGMVRYLGGGWELVSLLGDHASAWRMVGFGPVHLRAFLVIGCPVLLASLGGAWLQSRFPIEAMRWATTLVVVTLCAAGGIAIAQALAPETQGFQILSVSLVVPVIACSIWWQAGRRRRRLPPSSSMFALLCVLPYALALGSNVSITFTMAQGLVFWVMALAMAVPVSRVPTAALLHCVTAAALSGLIFWVTLSDGTDSSQPIRATQPSAVMGGTLGLRPEEAMLARTLRENAARAGWQAGDSLIDVTGIGAGYTVMLDGRFVGRAHLYGTWPGRVDSAAYALSRVGCEVLSSAWVLYSPDSNSDVSGALAAHGLDVEADYDELLRFKVQRYERSWTIRLLRPSPGLRPTNCQG